MIRQGRPAECIRGCEAQLIGGQHGDCFDGRCSRCGSSYRGEYDEITGQPWHVWRHELKAPASGRLMPRKTQRIPSSQRKRKEIKLTLGEEAHGILKSKDNASEYVEELVIDDASEKARRENP